MEMLKNLIAIVVWIIWFALGAYSVIFVINIATPFIKSFFYIQPPEEYVTEAYECEPITSSAQRRGKIAQLTTECFDRRPWPTDPLERKEYLGYLVFTKVFDCDDHRLIETRSRLSSFHGDMGLISGAREPKSWTESKNSIVLIDSYEERQMNYACAQ